MFQRIPSEQVQDFSIAVTPRLPGDSRRMALSDVRLAGHVFSIACTRDEGVVIRDGKARHACAPGGTIILPSAMQRAR